MMFPAFVPAAVRSYVAAVVEGDEGDLHGLAASLDGAEMALSNIGLEIDAQIRHGESELLDSLRLQKLDATERRDNLVADLECLRRLTHDDRMSEVFSLLIREIPTDEQLRGFFHSARTANDDYSKHRTRVRNAKALIRKIATTAGRLASELQQFEKTGVPGPGEFYSIPELLWKADNPNWRQHELRMWLARQGQVMSGALNTETNEDIQPELAKPDIELEIPKGMGGVDLRIEGVTASLAGKTSNADFAMGLQVVRVNTPPLSAMLQTLADGARKFTPSESGMIGVAISSQKENNRLEYVRALAILLIDAKYFTLTNSLIKAIEITANVTIDSPDGGLTHDDVRKALTTLAVAPLEDSEEI